jgi:hypothetical protein
MIVEEDMDHPLIGRSVLDEIVCVASQHLDSVRDKFHLHDFSHIGEELLEMGKQPLKRWEQTKPIALNEDQCEVQRSEHDD